MATSRISQELAWKMSATLAGLPPSVSLDWSGEWAKKSRQKDWKKASCCAVVCPAVESGAFPLRTKAQDDCDFFANGACVARNAGAPSFSHLIRAPCQAVAKPALPSGSLKYSVAGVAASCSAPVASLIRSASVFSSSSNGEEEFIARRDWRSQSSERKTRRRDRESPSTLGN